MVFRLGVNNWGLLYCIFVSQEVYYSFRSKVFTLLATSLHTPRDASVELKRFGEPFED
ncbi:Uncharacterised protein [Streptococcus pneumoniae]|nr:Uncharacterised protein [Streptococcus pneumoniae]